MNMKFVSSLPYRIGIKDELVTSYSILFQRVMVGNFQSRCEKAAASLCHQRAHVYHRRHVPMGIGAKDNELRESERKFSVICGEKGRTKA